METVRDVTNLEVVTRAVRRTFKHRRIDVDGNEVVTHCAYQPLGGREIAELVNQYGNGPYQSFGFSVLSWRAATGDVAFMLDLIWRAMRRCGLTKDDLAAERWKLTLQECGDLFPGGDIKALALLTNEIMSISGFEMKKPEAEKPKDPDAEPVEPVRPLAPTS